MRGRRLVAQGAVAAPCSSPWSSVSVDLTDPTTAARIEDVSSTPVAHGSWHLLSWRPCGVAAYGWRPISSSSSSRNSSLETRSSHQLAALYTHTAPRRSTSGFVRCSLSASLLQTCASASPMNCCSLLGAPSNTLSATRVFHTTPPCLTDALMHGASSAQPTEDVEESGALAYDKERHIESAGALLREVYGPQAKLVLHRLTQRRQPVSASAAATTTTAPRHSSEDARDAEHAEVNDHVDGAVDATAVGDAAPAQEFYYRASATFRFLGFAVELAVANGLYPKETIESCLHQAFASDITFIRPSSSSSHNQSNGASFLRGGGGRAEDSAAAPPHRRHQKRTKGKQQHHSNNSDDAGFAQRNANPMFASHAPRLTPHQLELKAIMDDLRQLCMHFSRTVKFSIKPPFAGGRRKTPAKPTAKEGVPVATTAREAAQRDYAAVERQWWCRCYVKDEWSTIAQARLAQEVSGSSPNDALARCAAQLRQRYKEELESPAILEEGVREVAGMVQLQHKKVTAMCAAEPTNPSLPSSATPAPSPSPLSLVESPTYRAHVEVTDAHRNTTTYTARQKASPYAAYETAASLALRAEALWDSETRLLSEGLPTPPLLWRLRWQFDLLLDHICRETGQAPEQVARIQLTGDTQPHATLHQYRDSGHTEGSGSSSGAVADSLGPSPGGVISAVVVPPVPMRFTGSLYSERDVLVWQTSGGGRYRVEFDTYVQALYQLLDQYADCLSTLPCMDRGVGEGLLFPTASVLDLHVHRHDAFPVLQHHHGKLNCYALLGTLTSQLLGCPYTTHYHYDAVANEYVATLTVNDGRVTNQPLIQRRAKKKGEAWRFTCLDAMKENFPRQYAAILDRYPEIDLSADDMARSAHLRALPREKRIPYFVNLSVMVMAFAEEDLGWRQPRVRLRNLANSLGLPQWTAELEAQVEGEEGRRVVAVSASFPQMHAARRSLIYRMAKQYFPTELAFYKSLKRSDITDPESEEVARVNKFYAPNAAVNSSMVSHVLALMEGKHPTSAPVRFTLEARVMGAAKEDSVEGGEQDITVASDAANQRGLLDMRYVEGDTVALYAQEPAAILRPPRIAYTARVLGNRGDVLIADFDSDSATTAADAQAVPVLVTALKSASFHLAGADAATLWTEYETHHLPVTTSARVLIMALFNRFFGSDASGGTTTAAPPHVTPSIAASSNPVASSGEQRGSGAAATAEVGDTDDASPANLDASITVVTTNLGDFWFGTAVLPRLGMLPIARAVASSKRKCIADTMIAAARHSFPRVLQHAVKHNVAVAAVAAEILTEPIVEQLPPSLCRDVLAQLGRKKVSGPPPPFQLLVKCTKETYPRRERFIRVQQTHDITRGYQCRLYLQRSRVMRPGDTQLVGYGVSTTSAPAALHRASVIALENLYETALYSAVTTQPNYREPPTVSN